MRRISALSPGQIGNLETLGCTGEYKQFCGVGGWGGGAHCCYALVVWSQMISVGKTEREEETHKSEETHAKQTHGRQINTNCICDSVCVCVCETHYKDSVQSQSRLPPGMMMIMTAEEADPLPPRPPRGPGGLQSSPPRS